MSHKAKGYKSAHHTDVQQCTLLLGWILKRMLTANLKKAVVPSYKMNVRSHYISDLKQSRNVMSMCGDFKNHYHH